MDCVFLCLTDMSPSIGTPPRLSQAPSLNDPRLLMPSLTPTMINKWDPMLLSDGMSTTSSSSSLILFTSPSAGPPMSTDPLNFNELFRSVAPATFGASSIRQSFIGLFLLIVVHVDLFLESTPSVGHPAVSRQYSSAMTQNLTVSFPRASFSSLCSSH